ncbi:putative proline oxidase Put1 [Aspergillus ibericus CBS 121593]|uniref:Proline dehydrogenase n=1 Tax=Aspergillus ibericus CBS 121593 TaxID=1448316 RepID=A0A395HE27_9EURO|nr:FAD-linked oxidoreductase [Aspergillus ibericus CBS 121593]RAL04484.1 FAD-linked oxidoreductase [Aspergillus ibericus CBS 121593]
MKSKVLLWPKRPSPLLYQLIQPPTYASSSTAHHVHFPPPSGPKTPPPLSALPTRTFLRSLLFTSVMASPLLRPCLSVLKYMVDSQSVLFSPGRNPVVNYLLRRTIYDHFCAGINETEVRNTVQEMRTLGFKGVILGYARESIAKVEDIDQTQSAEAKQEVLDRAVDEWKQGTLRTLKMSGKGNYLAVKFTGAGPAAVEALSRGDPAPPPRIQEAITEICDAVAAQGSRVWIDAEQQIFQSAIDAWAVDLMRKYNRDNADAPVVLNTYQAYLKSSTAKLNAHLQLAQKEGWAMGVKLVRGAYIAHDHRDRIHDTKADTDRNYDHIVESLITRQYPLGGEPGQPFPKVRLFVASHNGESVRKACALYRQRVVSGLPSIPVEVGQLQGMADEVSLGMVAGSAEGEVPGVFKCLAWGSTEECLHFLLRRAVENQSAMERTRDTARALREEAWRRLGGGAVL